MWKLNTTKWLNFGNAFLKIGQSPDEIKIVKFARTNFCQKILSQKRWEIEQKRQKFRITRVTSRLTKFWKKLTTNLKMSVNPRIFFEKLYSIGYAFILSYGWWFDMSVITSDLVILKFGKLWLFEKLWGLKFLKIWQQGQYHIMINKYILYIEV